MEKHFALSMSNQLRGDDDDDVDDVMRLWLLEHSHTHDLSGCYPIRDLPHKQ